jgi:hypothetical protein
MESSLSMLVLASTAELAWELAQQALSKANCKLGINKITVSIETVIFLFC